jgi:hypothetical protein
MRTSEPVWLTALSTRMPQNAHLQMTSLDGRPSQAERLLLKQPSTQSRAAGHRGAAGLPRPGSSAPSAARRAGAHKRLPICALCESARCDSPARRHLLPQASYSWSVGRHATVGRTLESLAPGVSAPSQAARERRLVTDAFCTGQTGRSRYDVRSFSSGKTPQGRGHLLSRVARGTMHHAGGRRQDASSALGAEAGIVTRPKSLEDGARAVEIRASRASRPAVGTPLTKRSA